ncbi:MAG: histidine-type phosphatase [Xanthomonadales bacterium]|nr:histidine-type phosphatase [Xanthomonadales bacterium]
MLMRHGVRSPTKAQVSPKGTNDQPWPKWPVGYGELTPHGADAARLLGTWDRANWAARGLLPATGCPTAADIDVAASATPRTRDTAKAWLQGFAPQCQITVSYPDSKKDDIEFHPFDAHSVAIDSAEAVKAQQAMAPAGGMAADVQAHAELYALLNKALGCQPKAACDLSQTSPDLVPEQDGPASVGSAIGDASTISQTFLLEYLQGMPMREVAWGRLTRAQIEELEQFHILKYKYEARAPYVADRAASPLASRMLKAVEGGPKLTLLAGHDTNIADLGGMLDLHWQVPSYPANDPPPGGALGFEVLANASGQQFVRVFYRAQTMDQVRNLQTLDAQNPASYTYLAMPGCAELCPLPQFEKLVSAKLIQPLRTPATN